LNPGAEKLTLDRVNELSREEFVKQLGPVFEDSPWVAEAAWDQRPFEDFSALYEDLANAMWEAPRERQMALIRAHPDLAGKAAVAGALTPESASEQASAGLDRLSPEEFEAFTVMNREYREKFGMPMIVCVREHTRESILRSARQRLGNSAEEEVQAALGEILKIARLRLEDLVEGGRR
jgi:2-oxo-4-hydroxy-4-carboxy-5-ureidoimidazoline decarboxylase